MTPLQFILVNVATIACFLWFLYHNRKVKPVDLYYVYINFELAGVVETEEQAWDIIGKAYFGALYEVRNNNGQIRSEFIPF